MKDHNLHFYGRERFHHHLIGVLKKQHEDPTKSNRTLFHCEETTWIWRFILETYGCFLKWWYPHFTPQVLISFSRKPHGFCWVNTTILGVHPISILGVKGHHQWSFLVPLIGGRWYIITQLAEYTTYIPLIYCQLGDYMVPTTYSGNQETPLTSSSSFKRDSRPSFKDETEHNTLLVKRTVRWLEHPPFLNRK